MEGAIIAPVSCTRVVLRDEACNGWYVALNFQVHILSWGPQRNPSTNNRHRGITYEVLACKRVIECTSAETFWIGSFNCSLIHLASYNLLARDTPVPFFFAVCTHFLLIRPFFVIPLLLCYCFIISLCVSLGESFPLLPLTLDALLVLGDLCVPSELNN